ncbi:hypothetical protein [Bradyrhizobium stylosanthis]|uniref:Uncharacterized protein n=1 Tax=Bradyrhizobium stylosanthis TaxID=1803665 RepID=A0A560CXK9_9BRAD|nr:hypothetical protein [Bradyrhizobium stylosanthis]TWA89571.1 hypothetical protein FBZ96_11939 [Bradyrhizobium stylosanthis]
MAYPTKYQRQYDYVAYQNANPSRPLPATSVHADLNAVAQSLQETIDFLKTALRDDGQIQNNAVGFDQLSLSVQAITGDPDAVEQIIADASASASAAATSAAAASSSAASASSSASNATTSANAAASSATSAGTSATNASNSASAASTSASAAATSASNAAATLAAAITGPGSSTDKTAVRFSGTGGKTGQASALAIADTTGALSRVGNGGIPLQGTNTNDNAAAGYVGEYLENNVTVAVNVVTNTVTAIASITLTPGDWDVHAGFTVFPNGNNTLTEIHCCLSNANNALTGFPFGAPNAMHVAFQDNQAAIVPTGMARWSVAVNTTVYAVINLKYTTGSTMSATACLWARRRR